MRTKSGSISFEARTGRYKAQLTTPTGRIAKRFGTKQEAADWITRQQNSILSGTYIEPSALTLGQWITIWLRDYKKQAISQRTLETYVETLKRAKPLANYKLQQITAVMVQSLYQQLADEGLGAPTRHKLHTTLKSAFKKALRLDLIPRNIMEAVDPPKLPPPKEIETFAREEIDKIFDAAREYSYGQYYPLIVLAVTTGMRRGELLGLRWCDVNFKKCEVSVVQNLQLSRKKGIIFVPPKTKAGKRTISVPAETVHQLQLLKQKLKIINLNGLVFTTRITHKPYDPHNFESAWRRIMKNTGVPYRNFHALRHTHATDLLANGVPIVDVAKRLGHSKVSHTLDIYAHAIPRYDKEIAQKVAQLYLVK